MRLDISLLRHNLSIAQIEPDRYPLNAHADFPQSLQSFFG